MFSLLIAGVLMLVGLIIIVFCIYTLIETVKLAFDEFDVVIAGLLIMIVIGLILGMLAFGAGITLAFWEV